MKQELEFVLNLINFAWSLKKGDPGEFLNSISEMLVGSEINIVYDKEKDSWAWQ